MMQGGAVERGKETHHVVARHPLSSPHSKAPSPLGLYEDFIHFSALETAMIIASARRQGDSRVFFGSQEAGETIAVISKHRGVSPDRRFCI